MMKRIKVLSLFANVGIAETYLNEIGVDVVCANEIDKQRVKFYKHLYPNTEVITGDITNDETKRQIINTAKRFNIDLIMATPPCQGMSTAGKQDKDDIRNILICHAVEIIKELKPKYVFLENVPEQLITKITYNKHSIAIPDYLKCELGGDYIFNNEFVINACNYGVPQLRERAIILLVRKDVNKIWNFPKSNKTIITMQEAIGDLPQLDPEISDVSEKEMLKIFPYFYKKKEECFKISKWFYPPKHVYRQVYSLMHTPSGRTAFDNIDEFKPKKKDGTLVKGFKNTYKRQCWDKPAFTVTMFNRTIGSQNNVHPGRYIGKDVNGFDLYSDARVLTIYELMIVSSLPKDWNIPEWASDHFVRQVIGEGIPPLLVKKIMKELVKINNE
ncbi:MAG: DNA cytosine methyltransferase [Clostridia bacterium]|nr:DNA cytosine methyltransferase [Clostridia bacterium]